MHLYIGGSELKIADGTAYVSHQTLNRKDTGSITKVFSSSSIPNLPIHSQKKPPSPWSLYHYQGCKNVHSGGKLKYFAYERMFFLGRFKICF